VTPWPVKVLTVHSKGHGKQRLVLPAGRKTADWNGSIGPTAYWFARKKSGPLCSSRKTGSLSQAIKWSATTTAGSGKTAADLAVFARSRPVLQRWSLPKL
jgi:hypothetical protein